MQLNDKQRAKAIQAALECYEAAYKFLREHDDRLDSLLTHEAIEKLGTSILNHLECQQHGWVEPEDDEPEEHDAAAE